MFIINKQKTHFSPNPFRAAIKTAILIAILINIIYLTNITKNTNDYWERKTQVSNISKVECVKEEPREIKNIYDCPALPADKE